MSTPLNHARHNKKACEHLDAAKEFPDWVITTAFYCSMHYIHAATFPFAEAGIKYNNITIDLIHKRHSQIGWRYKQLKDTAHTARYHDYEHPKEVVRAMKNNLKVIEEYCENKCKEKQPGS
jgi:protein associated with RNAse G/E